MYVIDPIILFFLLGLVAGLLRSELRLPAAIYEFVSILLLLSIGLKGGIELAKQPFGDLLPDMLAVVAMGFFLALLAFPVLRYVGRFKRADAASIAAHYGSVSVGTYAVAVAYLGSRQIAFEEHMPLLLVLLEIPAILVGIILARGLSRQTRWSEVAHEVFLGKSIVLLVGGLHKRAFRELPQKRGHAMRIANTQYTSRAANAHARNASSRKRTGRRCENPRSAQCGRDRT